MSIMDRLRKGSESTGMQLLIGVVFLSFVGFSGMMSPNDTVSTVVTVNGTPIMDVDVQRRYAMVENQREAMTGAALTEDEQKSLYEDVKKSMVRLEVLRQEADRLGLVVSTDEIALTLAHDPSFRGEDGKFDKKILDNMLQRQGLSLEKYQERMRDELLIQKLQRLVLTGVDLPDAQIKQRWVDASTTVELSYVMVSPRQFIDEVDVSDATVAAFVEGSKDKVEATYKADYDRLYNLPDRLDLSVIQLEVGEEPGTTLPELQALAESIREQLNNGADFEALAIEHSQDRSALIGGRLGPMPVATVEPAVVEATKEVAPGAYSAILTDEKQVRIFRVNDRLAAKVIPLEVVQQEIAKRLIQERDSTTKSAEYAEKLLAGWKVTGVAAADLLLSQELAVELTGPLPKGGTGRPTDPPEEMLKAAETATPGSVLPGVYASGELLYVGMLLDRKVPTDEEFALQKEGIRSFLVRQRQEEFFQAWVDDLEKRAKIQ